MNISLANNTLTREQWLNEANAMILDEIFAPVWKARASLKIRISVGFPAGKRPESNVIGVCHPTSHSTDGTNEIFITPNIDDSMLVLETLIHEDCHAIDDCQSGHRGDFATLARAVGLEGPLTATHGSAELRAKLQEYIGLLGPIPHAKLNVSKRKRDKNRNIKVWCRCGFKFNTSRTQVNHVLTERGMIACPACSGHMIADV